jgi:3-dehydroquinate dehydratase-1
MICVSIGKKNVNDVIIALNDIDFAEVRLDLIDDLSFKSLEKIIDKNNNLIITFRPDVDKLDEEIRISYLFKAIEYGVHYIDIEIETEQKMIKSIIDRAKNSNTKIIISYHNYDKTPSIKNLYKIIEICRNYGADFIKIATLINTVKDSITHMEILKKEKNIIAVGMGKMGKITRLMSLFMGSPFTYASLSDEEKTADGQLDYKKMRIILDNLQ